MMMALSRRPLSGQYILVQIAVVLCVFVLLALTPAPMTFPSGPWEAVLLLKGAAALIVANLLLASAVRGTDESSAPSRLPRLSNSTPNWLDHYLVVQDAQTIGIVDEVVTDRRGTPTALIVSHGWWNQRRFVLGLDEVRAVDDAERTITVQSPREEAP